ncbi:phage tail sheath family protein [Kistimonas asteriae]|uniref:phage tail sheath family protein n=1 Tax=Kistimonas asteriae TaxID=517724 RepID=UPI001BA8498B|nr:phage tail sheath C-terminal domain-containing protein [Kistimonas asteriae]
MQLKTPNVYVQEKSIFPPSVAEVATAIPAFIGRTEVQADGAGESLVNQPIRITSMVEFERWFGGPYLESFSFTSVTDAEGNVVDVKQDLASVPAVSPFILYHCVAHFFANGGGACHVVSVGNYEDGATATDSDEKALFDDALKAIAKIDEVTLLVLSDAVARLHDNTTLYYALADAAMAQCAKLKDRFTLIDTIDSITDLISEDMDALRGTATITGVGMNNLKYGASYYPYLRTTMSRTYDESQVTLDGVAMDDSSLEGTALHALLKTKLSSQYMVLPPCPAMAGIYARVDGSRGVWKAPANVSVSDVMGPVRIIDNTEQMDMNVDTVAGKSINAIRAFTGKGTLVWGARTLAGNDNEWRYIPVRRLFNLVEESVQKATGFAVFEPNTPFTWLKLKTMIESYLEGLWKQGALFGEVREQAFFVNVGLGQTMTEADINNGIMNIEIGLAAVRPAEFIVLTFSHKSVSS